MAGASSSSKAVNKEVLPQITIFEWIKTEIDELKKSNYTMAEGEALERVILNVANFMKEKYEELNQVDDIPLLLNSHIQSIYANPDDELTFDFLFVKSEVKKLLLKLVNWKEAKKKTQRNVIYQKQEPILNSALLRNSNENRLYQQISSVVVPLIDFDDSDDDKSTSEENRMDIAKSGSSSSATIFNNQNVFKRRNKVNIGLKANQAGASRSTNKSVPASIILEEPEMQNLVEVKKEIVSEEEPTKQKNTAENTRGEDNTKGASRYFRSSLQEECLENLFSKDSPEDVNLMNEKKQQIGNVKKEIMSEYSDDGANDGQNKDEYQSDDDDNGENNGMEMDGGGEGGTDGKEGGTIGGGNKVMQPISPNSVNASLPDDIQMNEGNENELSNSAGIGSTSKNSPNKIRRHFSQESDNILEKIHGKINIELEIDRCKSRKRRLIDESTGQTEGVFSSITTNEEYSEFSDIPSSSANLPWHKNTFQQSTAAPKLNNIAKPSFKYSDKIKKKLRVDHENEQKAKNKAFRKSLKVRFSNKNPKQYTFEIEEGNVLGRCLNGSPTRGYVPRTKKFTTNSNSSNHHQLLGNSSRQLSAQMQAEIKSMIGAISIRNDEMTDQERRMNNHEVIDEFVVPKTRLLITDSMLAKLDENAFRNMQILKLNGQKNLKIFVDVLGQQLEFIKNKKNLLAMQFSYIFILNGFDDVNEEKIFNPLKLIEMRKFFVDKLAAEQLQTRDWFYHFTVPQFVIITIPMVGPNEKKIQLFNKELREFVKKNEGDFLLLDWAKQIEKMGQDSNVVELIVQELAKMLGEFGVLIK